MVTIKQPAFYKCIPAKQYKLYDWLNIPVENTKSISEKYPDLLETPKNNKKMYLKIMKMNITPLNPVCPNVTLKKFIKYGFNEKLREFEFHYQLQHVLPRNITKIIY